MMDGRNKRHADSAVDPNLLYTLLTLWSLLVFVFNLDRGQIYASLIWVCFQTRPCCIRRRRRQPSVSGDNGVDSCEPKI
jgi:hypothetical protein